MNNEENKNSTMYSKELFNDEMVMIDGELRELDTLYSEIKTHFDNIKRSQARGSLVFLKDQTSNLISIKQAKLNYIKQRADMKKSITDFAFKEKASNKQDSQVDELTEAIYKKISSEFKYVPDDKGVNNFYHEETEKDIDSLLDADLTDENIENIIDSDTSIETVNIGYTSESTVVEEPVNQPVKENKTVDEEKHNTIEAVDVDTSLFYLLNAETFDIIEELGDIDFIVDETTIGEDSYAVGESGKLYLLVTMDE